MSHWQNIRAQAQAVRRTICLEQNLDADELCRAEILVNAAALYYDLELSPEHKNSANLRKCLAVLEDDVIFYDHTLKNWFKQFCIAHEIAHHVLHHISVHCSESDIESFAVDAAAAEDEELPSSALKEVIGYGASERREREANLFALELLLPGNVLRETFINRRVRMSDIAELTGLPVLLTAQQLSHAVLTPPIVFSENDAPEPSAGFALDKSQQAAAQSVCGPLLIAAGPGTGKTKTLIERILFLLETGIRAEEILALTFSNKATEEMRTRIARVRTEEAKLMEIMTFHSFGLNLLRKFPEEANLKNDSRLIAKLDAIEFLESSLNDLKLSHFQSLSEPTYWLPAILAAISRAKDELKSPADYRLLCDRMAADAQTPEEIAAAEKCHEIAGVYAFYQEHLERTQQLDFGDLIFRAWQLISTNDDARSYVKNKYKAVLVDEYQDVNRASGKLLREVAGDGRGLWAVGDLRQSIYRWRGASPANINLFKTDYPQAEELALEKNYRSRSEVINLFSAFAGGMQATTAGVFRFWQAARTAGKQEACVTYDIAPDLQSEAESIAARIRAHREQGIKYREQAVICRTHAQLKIYAETLTARGIPVLYLGDLFEREEIRDLLALLDLKHTITGHSLIRVAAFEEYDIPQADVLKILAEAKRDEQNFQHVLIDEKVDLELSDAGKTGWRKLKTHLAGTPGDVSAWTVVTHYLFEQSRFLSYLGSNSDIQNQQRKLAIYQFLNFAKSVGEKGVANNIPDLLKYVRRLARFGEDKIFAQVPAAAENLDAVRLLTVHAAKGLEFEAVYLPFLGKGKFPQSRQGDKVPMPKNLIEFESDYHLEEEECLFFVGLSRAKDYLHLSRPATLNGKTCNPSPFLESLAEVLPQSLSVPLSKVSSDAGETAAQSTETSSYYARNFHAAQLTRYETCPRAFYYKDVLKLEENRDDAIYLKFHRTVYQTIGELQAIHQAQDYLTEDLALQRLSEKWREADLDAHPYGIIYRESAERMIKNMWHRIAQSSGTIQPSTALNLELENGSVFIQPDFLEVTDDAVSIQRFRAKKAPLLKENGKEEVDDADVILELAARAKFPDKTVSMNKIYLADDVERFVSVTGRVEKLRLAKYENIIQAINAGDFAARPTSDACPKCAYFFICPK